MEIPKPKSIIACGILVLEGNNAVPKTMAKNIGIPYSRVSVFPAWLSNLNQIWAASKDLASGRLYGYERLSDHEKQLLNPHLVKLYSMLEYIYSQMK